MSKRMLQYGPEPELLISLVERTSYRPGWTLSVAWIERDPESTHGAAAGGFTLAIFANVNDSYEPDQRRPVWHYFAVPAATYSEASWRRWLLDCLLKVEQHECCEYMQIDGRRPFAPLHGPGEDPYRIVELATGEQLRTSFRGVVKAE